MNAFEHCKTVTVNGTSLAAHHSGTGAPVVFVHGAVSDLRTWDAQIAPFSKDYQTIAYSRRYHLPNALIGADTPDPIEVQITDLIALIESLEAGPAHIVGHSWGALMTLMMAGRRPDLIRSAVLIEPPALSLHVNIPPAVSEMAALFVRNPRLAIAIAKLGAGLAAAEKKFAKGDDKGAVDLFSRTVLGRKWHDALTPARARQIWDNRGTGRALALFQGFPKLKGTSLADITLPVLLVSGAETPAVSTLLNADLQRQLPNAREAVIPAASHVVHEDNPQDFNAEVLAFIAQVT